MGVAKGPERVRLNGDVLDSSHWSYSEADAVLIVQGLNGLFNKGAWSSRWEMTWE